MASEESSHPLNIEDIAARAGVSRSTVSRVINNEPYVSEKTRTKVLAVINELGYTPNPAARALVTQRTQVIGVVIPHRFDQVFEDPYYFPTLLQGVSDEAERHKYAVLTWMGSRGEGENLYHRISTNRLMDGVILASPTRDEPLVRRLSAARLPFVMVERLTVGADDLNWVSIDNIAGARHAVEHLISLGRKRIATITGDLDNPDGYDRLLGYKAALQDAGLPILPELIGKGQFHRRAGYEAAQELIPHKPDAIFAGSDNIAFGILDALREAGLRVPDDVSIVGFDDLPGALDSKPKLTTVHQPIMEKAVQAARILFDLIDGVTDTPKQVILPTSLVIRDSCGARK